ncbi:hypothetical protein M409DRAFT_25716 [Zasmidium cellare ATCC 36951]|uniref:C2H2-type domain-containing protein n=1 Tax=Zasmidium cellare ATCC 36951 TaxID=1080233 RepID=A0A6A6CE65_ZASCE|nr:uncharacterized protein M409DRAFT_25716 [Zasmidium cellare ATCC 36951]KAF2163939.1 hypothetical protein M409DRAFT_25716 [Zasmidium cellare ATCC 36951]
MATGMPGTPYDMNDGSWSHEPQRTYDVFAAAPYFGLHGETLHMDSQPAYGFAGQETPFPLQTSPLEIQQTHESTVVSPLSLKRPGTDSLQVQTAGGLSRNGSKRSKQERLERRDDELYKCTWPGCSHKSNLMCEIRKHFQAKHRPDEARPHGCPHCTKRFNWPKDVRRHIKQKHKDITTPTIETPELIKDDSFESDEIQASIPRTLTSQTKASKKKKKLSFSSVGSLIVALQSLSLGSKDTDNEEDEKGYVLVTQDQATWQKVDLEGVKSSEILMQKIRDVYQKYDGQLLLYQHRNKKPNRRLEEGKLLHAAKKAADAHRTLEIVLAPMFSSSKHESG